MMFKLGQVVTWNGDNQFYSTSRLGVIVGIGQSITVAQGAFVCEFPPEGRLTLIDIEGDSPLIWAYDAGNYGVADAYEKHFQLTDIESKVYQACAPIADGYQKDSRDAFARGVKESKRLLEVQSALNSVIMASSMKIGDIKRLTESFARSLTGFVVGTASIIKKYPVTEHILTTYIDELEADFSHLNQDEAIAINAVVSALLMAGKSELGNLTETGNE